MSIYNRAEIINNNFFKFVKEGRFPDAHSRCSLNDSGLTGAQAVDIFESQVISRVMDLRARELKNANLCFYTIGSSGHEGNAVLGKVFGLKDMAFLHYRSGAFMVQRAKQRPGASPIYDGLLSFVASKDDPMSGGRHKVFGSYPLLVPPQTSTIASHLPKAVGAALSIGRAKDLGITSVMAPDSVVVCTFGDASANHATAQAAFNTASLVSYQSVALPLVFVCEDNGIGISVPTPQGWIASNFQNRPQLRYIAADGLNILSLHREAQEAARIARTRKVPVFLHMRTVRLMAHAGSDPEWSYHSFEKIEATEFQDPLLHSVRLLIEEGLLSKDDVLALYDSVRERVHYVSNEVVTRPKLETRQEIRATVTACRYPRRLPPPASEAERAKVFGKDFEKLHQTPLHMAKLINHGLTDILLRYRNAVIFGEDVAQKGGVYNVTDGLWRKFGLKRVFNSPLDETSILGNAIGMAHNGFLPIPEIQFLAYVHNAEDQLRGEASTLAFFSQGQFTNPMVVRVAGLGYQKGFGGHFHNDNSLAVFRDLPGVILCVPSNGADAVKMMRTAVRLAETEGRVVVFVEPIALYMTKDLHKEGDKQWSFTYSRPEEEIPFGEVGVHGEGDSVILTYGNGYFYSRQAELELREKLGVKVKVVDLRWLHPLPWDGIMKEIKGASRIIVVDECRKTGSPSEEIVAGLVERLPQLPKIKIIAADDCFIPLGPAAQVPLPKKDEIVAGILELLK